MKISILGCGWLGLPLGEALVADGHDVRGSTTRPDKLEAIEEAGIAPHLIRVSPEPQGQLEDFFDAELLIVTLPPKDGDTYLQKLTALVNAARLGSVQWFMFTSSTSVYDEPDGVVEENDPNPPASERGKMLRQAEALFLRSPVDATVLRLGGLIAEDRHPARFLAGKTDVSGPDAPVNLVHRDDVIGVVRAIIEHDVRNGIFNVVADEHPTKRELYQSKAEELGLEPPTFGEDAVPYKIVSNEKVKTALGYSFKHSFKHQPTP